MENQENNLNQMSPSPSVTPTHTMTPSVTPTGTPTNNGYYNDMLPTPTPSVTQNL